MAEGAVVPGFAHGAALLRDEHGGLTRLSWEDPTYPERRRALAAGRHQLVGYRLLARDPGGVVWHTSVSGASLGEFVVRAQVEQTLALEPTILLRLECSTAFDALRIDVTDAAGAGLALYRDGRRVRLGYRLLDARGATLREGDFDYG